MAHQDPRLQMVAAWWHLTFAVLNLGALAYHLFAAAEHAQKASKRKPSCR